MPKKNSLGNYLEFYGPYNWSASHTTPSRFLMSPPRKSGALTRLLQAGPMQPVAGVSEELPVELAPTTSSLAANQKPAAPKKQSGARRAWEVVNTPVADLVGGEGTTRNFLVGDVDRMINSAQRDLDQRAARGEEITYWDALKSVGALGMSKDAADFAASFTSPVSLLTSGLGVLGKGVKAAKPAFTAAQQALGTMLAIPSIYGLATGHPVDTLKSAAKVLTGGQSDVSPEQARQDLSNASGLAGVFGTNLSGFDFARGRLRNIPGELPAKDQRISYSDHDNSLIPMEEAIRRSNSPEFRKHAVEGGEQIAGDYGNRVKSSKISVSEYKGKPEPSATIDVYSDKRMSGDAAAAAIGKKLKQEAVLRFRPGVMGRHPEYTLTGLKDPVAALEVLKKYDVPGARIQDGNLVFVDLDRNAGKNIKSAAKELGASLSKRRGHARLIEAKHYGRILQNYEQQQNLLSRPPALTPLYLAGVATSYGAQPVASTVNSKRRKR